MPRVVADAYTLARERGVPMVIAAALLAHLTGRERAAMLTHLEMALSSPIWERYCELAARAAAGEPLAYLTGESAFFDLTFAITSDVLVPRPETELLVEEALAWAAHRSALRIADIGTGSGVMAITLAVHLPLAEVIAIDVSCAALRVARESAIRHGVSDRVHLVQSDLLAGVTGPFDIVVANLPYVQTAEILKMSRWEPRKALDGGPDGLAFIRTLLSQLPSRIAVGGLALLEIGADQGKRAAAMAGAMLPGADVAVLTDLAGLDRVVRVQTT
jgi:release factor glutamine methyltransferase